MDKQLFAELKQSLNEALEHAQGKRELRTTTLPRPPQAMEGAEIPVTEPILIKNKIKRTKTGKHKK